MSEALTHRFLARRPWLESQLHRAFPTATRADIEDALQDMWVDLRTSSRPLPSDADRMDGLMRCVAWRRLRGRFRRHARKLEEPRAWEVGSTLPGQEVMAERWRWGQHFGQVVAAWGGAAPDALALALSEKMHTHEADTTLAPRHGLTRERLNGAWNALLERLLPRKRRPSRC